MLNEALLSRPLHEECDLIMLCCLGFRVLGALGFGALPAVTLEETKA